MRKTNVMLLAALIAAPFAMADDSSYGGGYYGGGYDDYDGDVTIEGSKNKSATIDVDIDYSKKVHYNKYESSDDDYMKLKNVGNTYYVKDEDNSEWDASIDKHIEKELNHYLAKSKLYGGVMSTEVTYGGACCKGTGTDVMVDHSNMMGGAYQSASGINIAGQNVGNNSMVQQTTSTNAALVGSGGGTLPGGGGSY
ncbi:hypothetical protein ACFFLZ_05055 [Photobacterium aphoticum]|uniref:Uncharacterized protein n=1 Tax=Photobacterium aphoticum TaxID=754436 RepID=A0A090QLA0_9GAMM|nr:hypothetical protein [Photobacterium aphoticum]PSU58732.1 hypothetical protein C9I90_05795 [Photobacterium aphoticum]GAL02594.1 hypothetical protein JCM19237_5487 [Photobacterium aphoticum]GHA32421.1 hypothetical protein GCM10007086_01930 [Photobacterium aphoticum]